MTRRARTLAAGAPAAVLAALFALVGDARTAGPGAWSEAQGPGTLHPGSEISATRGIDGSLFVAFNAAGSNELTVSKLATDGTRLSTEPAIDAASTRPAIVTDPAPGGTIRVLYGGFRSPPGESGAWMATAPAAGTPWSDPPVKVSNISSSYTATAVDPNGVLFTAATVGDPAVHRGTNPADTDHVYDTEGGQQGGLALDGTTGAPTLAWILGVAGGAVELRARSGSASTGAATGTVIKAPGLSGATADVRVDQNAPIGGRTGRDGVYVAYADDNDDQGKLLLWRVGDALPRQVAVSSSPIRRAALAPAPDGSLWIAWVDDAGATSKVAARELRPDGTTLGPITSFDVPDTGGFLNIGQLVAVAQADRVDLLLVANSKIFHSQVKSVPAGGGSGGAGGNGPGALSDRVRQTDGVPVADALVEACPQPSGLCLSVITDADGRYRFDALSPGAYAVTAWPPPRSFLNTTTRNGASTVPAGAELGGQDIVMSGPLRRPRTAFMTGPGFHGDVNGVPVIVRNQPIFWFFDLGIGKNEELVDRPMIVGFNTDDPETVELYFDSGCVPIVPAAACVIAGIGLDPVFLTAFLRLMKPSSAGLIPPCDTCDEGGGGGGPEQPVDGCPPFCEPTCPPVCIPKPQTDPQRWGIWWDIDQLQRGKSRGWTICALYRRRSFFGGLPTIETSRICYTVWIDPSGFVRTTEGIGVPGAKVVLLRSDALAGPFERVANGSARMSPANRRNPDVTDSSGHFGWDVVSGHYKVTASKRGCTHPRIRRRKSVSTSVYAIPPPVTDINMRMRCPPAPASARRPALSGTARVGRPVTCSRGRWRNKPKRYRYGWRLGKGTLISEHGRRYRPRNADRRKKIACLVLATNAYGRGVAASRPMRVH